MSDAKSVNLIFLRGFRRNKKFLKEGFFLLNLKGRRAQAKAIGIKYYYRMSRIQLENIIVHKCVFHINHLKAVFVQAQNYEPDSNVIGTFSFSCFNDNGKRDSITFTLTKKYTRSVTVHEKIITRHASIKPLNLSYCALFVPLITSRITRQTHHLPSVPAYHQFIFS